MHTLRTMVFGRKVEVYSSPYVVEGPSVIEQLRVYTWIGARKGGLYG